MTLQSLMSKAPLVGNVRVNVWSHDGEDEVDSFDFTIENADESLKNHPELKPYGACEVIGVFANDTEIVNGCPIARVIIEVKASEVAK